MTIVGNKVQVRLDRERECIKALAEMLRNIAAEPGKYIEDKELADALKSQGALAKYAPKGSKLCPMSLNHQKTIAAEAVGQYEILDQLRKGALKSLRQKVKSSSSAKRPSREDLGDRISQLQAEVDTLLEDLVIMQKAFDTRCLQARSYAKGASAAIQALCVREQREIETWLSLRKRPSKPGSLAFIGGGK